MALTATATQGFELLRHTTGDEVLWLPTDPGVTYTEGDTVAYSYAASGSYGLPILAGTNSVQIIGTVLKTTIAPSLATPYPQSNGGIIDDDSTQAKALVKIRPHIAAGVPVFKATFASHIDDTVISYTAATPQVALTTGAGADDRPAGALCYVYEGPGAGEVNVAASYDHTGGAVEKMLVFHRAFNATLTSASKLIIVSGEAASNCGISLFARCGGDVNNLVANQNSNDGYFVVYGSWHEIGNALKNLWLPVVPASYFYSAALSV